MVCRICPDFAKNYPERAKKESEAQVVKAENGKLKISATAMGKVEEKHRKERTVKLPSRIVETIVTATKRPREEEGMEPGTS
jgi:hypothetical protein